MAADTMNTRVPARDGSRMKDVSPNADDLLVFTRMMQAAGTTRMNFPRALEELAARLPKGQALSWANDLSEKMSRGHSLGQSIKSLEGIDPTLAALLSVPGGYGFESLLTAYSRYLLLFTRLSEQIKTAILYPMLVLWISLLNLAILNLFVFPVMRAMFEEQHQQAPLILRLLFIGDSDHFLVSLPVPLAIAALAVMAARVWLVVPPQEMPSTLFGRLLLLSQLNHAERIGRFQFLIALFLRAGYRLTDAIRFAAGLGTGGVSAGLIDKAERLERGEEISLSFEDDEVLLPICGSVQAKAEADDVAELLETASATNIATAGRLIGRIESFGLIIGLFAAGVIVLLLTLAFFDPYFTLIRGAL